MNDPRTRSSRLNRLSLILVGLLLCAIWAGTQLDGAFSQAAVRAAQDGNDEGEIDYDEHSGGKGGDNIVETSNHKDGRLRLRGRIQLNRIPGQTVEPVNSASAYASCTDCQTLAVAMQINLIGRHATRVVPQNLAVAVNYQCTRCVTVAVALQYVYSVDDPNQVPKDVDRLIKQMNKELKSVAKDKDATLAEAIDRINAVIAQFQALATSLDDERDRETARTSPDATPEASPAASPEASPEASSGDSSDAGLTEPAATTAPQSQAEATTTVDQASADASATQTEAPESTATSTPTLEPTTVPEEEGSPPA